MCLDSHLLSRGQVPKAPCPLTRPSTLCVKAFTFCFFEGKREGGGKSPPPPPPLRSGPGWQPPPCHLTLAVLWAPKAGTTPISYNGPFHIGNGQQEHHLIGWTLIPYLGVCNVNDPQKGGRVTWRRWSNNLSSRLFLERKSLDWFDRDQQRHISAHRMDNIPTMTVLAHKSPNVPRSWTQHAFCVEHRTVGKGQCGR